MQSLENFENGYNCIHLGKNGMVITYSPVCCCKPNCETANGLTISLQQQTGKYVITIPLKGLALFSTLYPGGTDEYSYTHFHMQSLKKNNKN